MNKKKLLFLLIVLLLSLMAIAQNYTSDTVLICHSSPTGNYTCKQYPSITYIQFSPISAPRVMSVTFSITKETSNIRLNSEISRSSVNDSTTIIFYDGVDPLSKGMLIVSIKLINKTIDAIGIEDEESLLVFLIKKE